MDALLRDVRAAVASGLPMVDTVFVGGGTPSIVNANDLMQVINALPLADDHEITIECNPDNVTTDLFGIYAREGVTRVSLGVQSMETHVLNVLGRTHNPDNVAFAVGVAKDVGIGEINLDLIYGSVGESLKDVERTITKVISLAPTHVSAYGLTVEPGTPLSRDPSRFPDDDDEADKYMCINDALESAGYFNYEISNWAHPGSECRHNLLYWRQGNYRGFGAAAHSHLDGRRFWNLRTPERYIEAVNNGSTTEASFELLDADARLMERLQLALRMREGVPVKHFTASDQELLAEMLVVEDGVARLNPRGRLLANEIAVRLVP